MIKSKAKILQEAIRQAMETREKENISQQPLAKAQGLVPRPKMETIGRLTAARSGYARLLATP